MKNNSSFIIRLFITGFVLAIVFAFVSPGALGNVSADTPLIRKPCCLSHLINALFLSNEIS